MRTKIMIAVIFSLILTVPAFSQDGLKVAKADFDSLQPLLLEIAFKKEKNQELKAQHEKHKTMEERMLGTTFDAMENDGTINMKDMASDISNFTTSMNVQEQVEDLAKAELILIIEELFNDKYQLVIYESYDSGILYTTIEIPDITANIKQHLLKIKATEEDEESSDKE